MKYILTLFAIAITSLSYSQTINWNTLNEDQKNIVYLNFGYDFGVTAQAGFGQKFTIIKPILLTTDYSSPMGNNLLDDFKLRVGAQIPIYEKNNFILSGKAYIVYRKHETSLVKMTSFGSEFTALIGYYKPTWHIAGEFGFDQSANTYVKHSNLMKENFTDIKDGWITKSSGHFYYGIQGSKTIGQRIEISLKVGATNAQGKDENALLPFYGQLGLIYKFSSKRKD